MKIETGVARFGSAKAALAVAVMAVMTIGSQAQAVQIVYEGFEYPTGYLGISDSEGLYDNLDDGNADPDPITGEQNTKLGDPGRNGGTGSWVTSWVKRSFEKADPGKIDGESTLSFTDSKGNALATKQGKVIFPTTFKTTIRMFDAATIDPSLTMPNTGSESGEDFNFGVDTLGKQGTTIWMSFLGDFGPTTGGLGLQLYNKRDNSPAAGNPIDRTGGFSVDTSTGDWYGWDTAKGEEFDHEPGVSGIGFQRYGGEDDGSITGSGALDDAGDVFIVAKFDFSATSDSGDTDGWANVSLWANPDLDTEPTEATAGQTGGAYVPFNGFAVLSTGTLPNSDDEASALDEIRVGTTYADVAPIAGGGGTEPGDYDASGAVGQGDLDLVLLNWGNTAPPVPAGWVNEQPSGLIGQGNLDGVLLNWGNGSTTVAAVPEPTSVMLLSVAGALCCLRRRSK